MENYLLGPAIVANALGIISQEDWSQLLVDSALRIRWYEIARWTIGQVRRSLPPQYELETRPSDLNELEIPEATDEQASRNWCLNSIREFATRVEQSASSETITESFELRNEWLSEECLSDAIQVLVWCSGKDLFAALPQSTLDQFGFKNAGELRAALRDWIRENIEVAVNHFPEWQDLRKQVQA